MKKILSILMLVNFLVLPAVGLANGDTTPVDVIAVLNRIVNWLFTILVAVAGIAIVIAGYYFVTAAGNPEQITKAKNFIYYALIGVVVGLLARSMVWMVQKMIMGVPKAP